MAGTNLIKQKYNSTSSNHVICIDETSLGAYGTLFLAIDLASRCVICHCYHSENLNQFLVVEALSMAIRQRSFLPPILIIHSDRGSIFKNETFSNFLTKEGIIHSRGSAEAHQNQVVERLNRTIKEILKGLLDPKWRVTKSKPLKQCTLSFLEFGDLVKKSIEIYNSKPHRSLDNRSPNNMEEALFHTHGNIHPKAVVLYDSKSLEYKAYQTKVLQDFDGDWERFFMNWLEESRSNHAESLSEIRLNQAEIVTTLKEKAAEALKQYETLYEKYHKIQKDLEQVLTEALMVKEAREAKESRKLARKGRKKRAIREVITLENLTLIFSLVKGRTAFQISRRRLGLILLYFTGLRVSNLLILTIQNVRDLFSEGKIKISLIKGGDSRFDLVVGSKDRKHLVKFFQTDLNNLSLGKDASGPLFTNKKEIVSLSRVYLDTELNSILQKASILLSKHIRTHSFRASYVTDWLEVHDIHEVQDLIGHKTIASTNIYRRSRLTPTKRSLMVQNRPNSSKKASSDD